MASIHKGILGQFMGSWLSGLGFLEIDGRPVPCENGPTVRALDACFGNVIRPGHTISNKSFDGREVVYSVDDLGLLLAFTPVEDWTGPDIPPDGLEEE
jgi:hypothetical protein